MSNKIPVFEEQAAAWGIADMGYSHMAAFFDYDLDGDLDLYILTNRQSDRVSSNYRKKINDGTAVTNDRLYRNNGNQTFTNVTSEAGIRFEGFGLGLAISDFNSDGWPDVYVCNDFITNDLLYINNQDGTFSNQIAKWVGHQSQSSMGNDAADFNNDGLVDITTMDMLPETNVRTKTAISNKSYQNYVNNERFGYEYQYMRNMLHLNNGLGDGVGFSEIGMMAGVFRTEWSWSSLFADLDNDGWKDLIITNGFPRDITDSDFINYREDVEAYISKWKLLDSIPVVKIPNYIYRNNGDLTFTDVSRGWGFASPSFSNGAAYVDLDNDGDLDYIVNNINDPAFVYENQLITKGDQKENTPHYLKVKLVGSPQNLQGIGAKLWIHSKGSTQFFENFVARGYISSVESGHLGLGKAAKVDSIRVQWPDGKLSFIKDVAADQVVTIEHAKAEAFQKKATSIKPLLSVLKPYQKGLSYFPNEEDRIDFNLQRTIPHKFTQAGPGMAVGDVNGDSLEDLVIGGAVGQPTTLFLQNADGTFTRSVIGAPIKPEEDEGLLLFDADGDQDLDLYCVSGSIEAEPGSPVYQDRLYLNDGKGQFTLDRQALPELRASGSCVRAADIDQDGDLDLFCRWASGARELSVSCRKLPFTESGWEI